MKKKLIVRYSLEFLVIFLGISISFYLESNRENQYKENLKKQSLNRILNNIGDDKNDFEYNLKVHDYAIKSCEWLIKNNKDLKLLSNDSIGYHLGNAIKMNTVIIDNQEEYRGLQNSGLIELIENDTVVVGLQSKYINNDFCKKLENKIYQKKITLLDFLTSNVISENNKSNEIGFQVGGYYVSESNIPQNIIEKIRLKKDFHSYYISMIKTLIESDKKLMSLIKKEIKS